MVSWRSAELTDETKRFLLIWLSSFGWFSTPVKILFTVTEFVVGHWKEN